LFSPLLSAGEEQGLRLVHPVLEQAHHRANTHHSCPIRGAITRHHRTLPFRIVMRVVRVLRVYMPDSFPTLHPAISLHRPGGKKKTGGSRYGNRRRGADSGGGASFTDTPRAVVPSAIVADYPTRTNTVRKSLRHREPPFRRLLAALSRYHITRNREYPVAFVG
jgi:hypothetical protein